MLGQTTTHATLLQRVASGSDPHAWREFCDRYGQLIRSFARRQDLQSADRDEVVQEVLLALTKSMPGFTYDPAKGKFRSYLKTVVLHAIYRRLRQNPQAVRLEDIEGEIKAASVDSADEQAWEEEWRQYHLRQAMQTIKMEFSEADLSAFDAYAINGRDVRETAESLGLSVDQVYQAKSRILKRLSQIIKLQVEEEG